MNLTAHCLIKNEENFIWYAVKSVIDHIDQIIIFDTGSTDRTIEIVKQLASEYPGKIVFEEKGEADKKHHTKLRQEMIERTTTDWFMILDGDEVWTERGLAEALAIIKVRPELECLVAPFYLCVGDVFHKYYKKGGFEVLGQKDFLAPRFIKNIKGVHWQGDYDQDVLVGVDNQTVAKKDKAIILKNKYWHLTHLTRSKLDDQEYSSGGNRFSKRRLTYFLIGRKIDSDLPEVFVSLKNKKLTRLKSFGNFISLLFRTFLKPFQNFVWPDKKGFFIISLFALYYIFICALVINGDGTFGYALINKIHDIRNFASNDLVINSLLSSNFFFYKSLAALPFFSANFVLFDFLLSIPLSALVILFWYNIFYFLSKGSRLISLMSIVLVLLVDARLSMGGTILPIFTLISATSVYWLLVLAVYFFISNYQRLAIILAAATVFFHPAAGFFFLAIFGLTSLSLVKTKAALIKLLKTFGLALMVLIPSLILLGNNTLNAAQTNYFFDIFYRLKSGHIYLEDYWYSGYLYTISSLLLILAWLKKKNFLIEAYITIKRLIIFTFVLVGAWLINLYFFKNLSVFYLYLPMRSTYIVKPIFIFFIAFIAFNFYKEDRLVSKIVAGFLILSLLLSNLYVSLGLILLSLLYLMIQEKINNLSFFSFKISGKFLKSFWVKAVIFLIIVVGMINFSNRSNHNNFTTNNKFYKLYRLINGQNLFNYSFDKEKNFSLDKKNHEASELIDWAKSFRSKMFILPLDDGDVAGSLRFITNNSVYINIFDMGQMNYAPKYYFEGFARLKELGFEWVGQRGYDLSGYNKLTLAAVKKLDADFIVFDKTSLDYEKKEAEPVYENNRYIVYKLR